MKSVGIIDTTLRDGHQSLWACWMRASAMLPALADLDAAGFDSIEFTVPSSQFSRAVKDLHENPWDWLKLGAARATRTPLRLHGNATSPYTQVPPIIEDMFLGKLTELGVRTTRISDPWNDFDAIRPRVDAFHEHGFNVVVNVIYSESPRHDIDYFARKTAEAAALNPFRICFKDVGGLLTPERAREVLPVVIEHAGGVPVEFHGHCSNGFGPYVALMAAEAGCQYIHTAVPPLANGSSLPSVFTTVENLRARGFTVDVDLEQLERVQQHLARVAEVEGLPVGEPVEYEESLYVHQVPGGMISNLRFQLERIGQQERVDEALHEVGRVRADLGYPIMVTPLSQFVGSQAAINVITGDRYSTVTDEIIEYTLGNWGVEAPEVMDKDLRAKILALPRTADLQAERGGQRSRSLEDLRREYGQEMSDEELIMRVLSGVGKGELNLVESPDGEMTYEDYEAMHSSLQSLVDQVSASPGIGSFSYRSARESISIRR